jgi:hypothetical protein
MLKNAITRLPPSQRRLLRPPPAGLRQAAQGRAVGDPGDPAPDHGLGVVSADAGGGVHVRPPGCVAVVFLAVDKWQYGLACAKNLELWRCV